MQTTNDIADTLKMISDIIRDKDLTDLMMYKTIFDLNGNDVGRYAIKDQNGDTLPDKALIFNEVK
jgi:ethanolamine utilization cobalamin adenosyltransferase